MINYHGKPLSQHSAGQRASALVLFILSQHENDIIIIDQPEDDLDNQVIYREIIKSIKEKKPGMQFIFATHNANIPVLGDAENIIQMKEVDSKFNIINGTIDNPQIQNSIVDIMEGGTEAFKRRNGIYEIWTRQI
jgi:ABC-type lipoprotein export system ATPase subunit